jgi:hypothetical protein
MRGQVSLEYLALFLVALSLLSVSVLALASIRDSSGKELRLLAFHSSATSLAYAMDEVCALGDGNRRVVPVRIPLALEMRKAEDGWLARFSAEGTSMVRLVSCDAEDMDFSTGMVYVENEKGDIVFKGQ